MVEVIPAIEVKINGIIVDIDILLENLKITEEDFIDASNKKEKERKRFNPIKGLLDDIMKDPPKDQRQKTGATRGYDVNKPSKKPMWVLYKKRDIEDWVYQDFIGYYINLYKEHTGHEDPEFQTHLYGTQKIYVVKAFLNVFEGNKVELKKYLGWVIPWIMSEESWVDPVVNFFSVFGKKGPFLKNFQMRDIKKGKSGRSKDDNHYADKDNWKI